MFLDEQKFNDGEYKVTQNNDNSMHSNCKEFDINATWSFIQAYSKL